MCDESHVALKPCTLVPVPVAVGNAPADAQKQGSDAQKQGCASALTAAQLSGLPPAPPAVMSESLTIQIQAALLSAINK
jgi:hypothetical protein